MKRALLAASLVCVATLAYLVAWPTGLSPIVAPSRPDPGLAGPFAPNDALRGGERMFAADTGPVGGLAIDPGAHLNVATSDGRVLRLMGDGTLKPSGVAGGSPVGLAMGRDRAALVADPGRGIVLAKKGMQQVFASEAAGLPFGFPVGVAIGLRTGQIYFDDASDAHGAGRTWAAFVEGRPRGRLFATDDLSGHVRVLAEGLHFPAGIALAPDESYLLVAEATAFRVQRYWLTGDRAGTHDVFIGDLPGYPFALASNGKDRFWLSLYAPRIDLLERLAGSPFLRNAMFRLPRLLQPRPARHAIVLGIDGSGAVTHNLQDAGSDAFAPVTSVAEHDGALYLGSYTTPGVLRVPLR